MINLLPPSAKKRVSFEYWTRVVSVFFIGLSLLVVALAIENAPSYILVKSVSHSLSLQSVEANAAKDKYSKIESSVSTNNDLIKKLSAKEEQYTFSTLWNELENLAGNDVELNNIVFTKEGDVLLKGIAKTRASLSEFGEGLDSSSEFENVELPLSNLAGNTNVSFTIDAKLIKE